MGFLTGFFVAVFMCWLCQWFDNRDINQLKEENNKLRRLGKLHIGQVVYACNKNSLYIGEITKIVQEKRTTLITLNDDEEFSKSDIYLTKDEALKQLEI